LTNGFIYSGEEVKFKIALTDDGYVLEKRVKGKLVGEVQFDSKIAAITAKYRHIIAKELGAKFNEQGFWSYDTIPRENRAIAEELQLRKRLINVS
jgi:hypothetical protein